MDELEFVSVDKLPDDPLKMPPPYWRSGGSIFQLMDAVSSLVDFLHQLLPIHAGTNERLEAHYIKYPSAAASMTAQAMQEFNDICDELWELEHKIKMKSELGILMAAIHAEELINQFCVFNLPKELVETLERLSPADKLTAAASHLGHSRVRSTAPYGILVDLSTWRNAFAHGHCIDRPVKTLRHNHLVSPNQYWTIPGSVGGAAKHLSGYIKLSAYLAGISRNPYTVGGSAEEEEIKKGLRELKKFQFSGSSQVYDVSLRSERS